MNLMMASLISSPGSKLITFQERTWTSYRYNENQDYYDIIWIDTCI